MVVDDYRSIVVTVDVVNLRVIIVKVMKSE
jgi:hypothetical protein